MSQVVIGLKWIKPPSLEYEVKVFGPFDNHEQASKWALVTYELDDCHNWFVKSLMKPE